MSAGPALDRRKAGRIDALLLPAVLLLAAAAISGFTVLRGLDPYDEGQILLGARRIAQGEWPYADFVFPYGPGHPLLLAGLEKLFGTSLLWWRLVRVAADAAVALLVFVLARRAAPLPVALLAWLIAATGMAQPGGPNPFPVALALGLGAFAVATAPRPAADRWGWRRPAAAGALVALAGFWRVDFGLFAGAAVFVALALAPVPRPERLRALGVFAAAGLGIGALLYAPFAIVAGPATLYERMVADGLRYGSYWTLPFPFEYDGGLRSLAAGRPRRGPEGRPRATTFRSCSEWVWSPARSPPWLARAVSVCPGVGPGSWSSGSARPPTCAAAPTSSIPSR